MVDQVLAEQNAIEVEGKPDVKSNRRRNNRRTRNPKQENEEKTGQSDLKENAEDRKRDPRRRQRAPRVRTEGEGEVKEKADFTDGTLRLKISSSRPRTIYTRLVRLMLAGYDGMGNPLEITQPIQRIEVSALGNAIGSAIFVADNLIKGSVVEQVSMSADFVNVDGDDVTTTEENKFKGSPRLLISLKRLSTWDSKNDEVLQKTKVFRSKVLGLPEESSP